MRKAFIAPLIALAMLTMLVTAAMAGDKEQVDVYDEQKQLIKSVVFMLGHDYYYINNQTTGTKMDARPFAEQGRTFVPIRYLSNALGVSNENIGWAAPRVTLDEPGFPVVELAVGSKQLKSDGKVTTMDVSPLARDGRTYLPARWVAEALGYQVDWMPEHNIVLCYPKGAEKPDINNVIEHIKAQAPVVPVQPQPEQPQPLQPQIPAGETRPFSGTPLNPDSYVVAERKAIPYEFKQSGASIMEMTAEELRQKPVKMGNSGYRIIYDVDIQKDMVHVKQAGSIPGPVRLVFAKDNDVSVQRDNTLKKYASNPFTHGYYVSLEADPGGGTKIEDVTHVMLLYSNQVLAIQNPLYKGGK